MRLVRAESGSSAGGQSTDRRVVVVTERKKRERNAKTEHSRQYAWWQTEREGGEGRQK